MKKGGDAKNILQYAAGMSDVELGGNAGQTMVLQPSAANGRGGVAYAWEPKGRPAMDLEVRIQVQAPLGSTAATSYRIFYRLEMSAGESVFTEPRATTFNTTSLSNELILPDRGLQFRVNARRLKLTFRLVTIAGPLTSVELNVAVQPARGSQVPVFPAVHQALDALSIWYSFPLAATECRFRDINLLPFVAAAETVTVFNLCGATMGLIDAARFADWNIIPPFASFFMLQPNPAIVEYRA